MIATLNVRETSYTPDGAAQAGAAGEGVGASIPILAVSGRLDASTVNVLERALLRAYHGGARVILIDLGEVTYISSSGLRVLLTTRRQARERAGDVMLCALSSNVRDVLSMVGFTALFSIYDTLEDAKQSAARMIGPSP